MQKQRIFKDQKGVAVLELLLVVVVIGVLGFVGYKYLSSSKSSQNESVTVSRVAGKKCVSGGYCHISEWGIKFKTNIEDMIYAVKQESAEQFTAGLSDPKLSQYEGCAPKEGVPPYGEVLRFEKDAILPIQAEGEFRAGSAKDTFTTKIGSYYYLYNTPHSGCSEELPDSLSAQVSEKLGNFNNFVIEQD